MYRRYKERFGTVGVALGVIALILALGGTALAASGALTGKQKKEVEKIAKKYAGKPGAPGAPGTAGTNGTNGTNGKDGAPGAKGGDGTDGTPGTAGTAGADGKSVVEVGTAPCPAQGQGGVAYEIEESGEESEICNGKEGSPWTAGGTLPAGATETGTWSFTGGVTKITTEVEGQKEEVEVGDTLGIWLPISFPIRFPFSLKKAHVHFGVEGEAGFSTPCPGNVELPTALPGELCVYENSGSLVFGAAFRGIYKFPDSEVSGTTTSGATLAFTVTGPVALGSGSFAVTGCKQKAGQNECE